MNKKKALYTSLAALALAATANTSFAEEVDATVAEPVVAEVPATEPVADTPAEPVVETPTEAPAEAPAPAEQPAEPVVETPVEQPAEPVETQVTEVADAPAAASAGEETNTGSVVIPVEYEIRNKPASANRNQFDLLFSVPNSADLDILKSNSGDVYVRFSELASPGGGQLGLASDVKLEPSADGQRYVGMYEYAPQKDKTDLYFKIFKTKSTIEKSVTISDEQAIVIENGVARIAASGETVPTVDTTPAVEETQVEPQPQETAVEEPSAEVPSTETPQAEAPKTDTPAVEETATEPAKEAPAEPTVEETPAETPAEPVGALASQANLSYGVSGSTEPVMVDSVKLYDESGNVIYDGARNNAQTVADILAELGLPTDARVTNVGTAGNINGTWFVGTVILPEGTTATDVATDSTVSETTYNNIVAVIGGSEEDKAVVASYFDNFVTYGENGITVHNNGKAIQAEKIGETTTDGFATDLLVVDGVSDTAAPLRVTHIPKGSTFRGIYAEEDLIFVARGKFDSGVLLSASGKTVVQGSETTQSATESETVKVPVATNTEAPAPAVATRPTYSRTEKAQSEKGILPSTGEAVSILGVLGAGLSALGLAGLRRRNK